MPLLPPQLRLLYPSLPLTRLPPFLHTGFGLGFSKSRTFSFSTRFVNTGRGEVRASKSLIEDEEDLSNWVTGLRTSSFRSGALTEDEDGFSRGGKGKRGGGSDDVEGGGRGGERISVGGRGGRGGRGGYDRSSSNVGPSRRSSDGNSRFGGGNDRRGGTSSYNDGNSRFGDRDKSRGGLSSDSYGDRSSSRSSRGGSRFGDREKRGGLSSNSYSDRSSSRSSSGNSRFGGGMERGSGGREGGRGRGGGGGRMSSRGGRSGGRGGFVSEEVGVDKDEFGVYEGRKGKAVSGFMDLISEDDSEEDESDSEGEEIEAKSRSSLFGGRMERGRGRGSGRMSSRGGRGVGGRGGFVSEEEEVDEEEFGVFEGRKGKVGQKEKPVSGFMELISEDDSEEDVDDVSDSEDEEIEARSKSSLLGNEGVKSSSVASSVGTDASYLSETRFDQCAVSPLSLKAIRDVGYEKMTMVQEATLPVILKGKDVMAKARTGTGKTVAFLLPSIEAVIKTPSAGRDERRPPILVLVVCPTRELASQAAAEANTLLKYHPSIGVQVVIGGTRPAVEQKRMQANPCQILVATPGRLRDHLENTAGFATRLMGVKVLVLDEADHLLDMGFRRDIEKIVAAVPKQRQTLLFSATIPDEVRQICHIALKKDYEYINTVQEGSGETHAKVRQTHLVAPLQNQFSLLYAILKDHISDDVNYKVLVFCTTAMVTKLVADLLGELKLNVREIHSRKPQSYRTRVSDEFRKSTGLILVTSDVSARGVDYPDVTLVIQVGLPSGKEQYIHRLGRTGRKGKEGQGILLLAPWEDSFLHTIKDLPISKATPPMVDPDARKKVERALSKVEMKNKEAAYQAWLGYYNSAKSVGRDKIRLVELANEFSQSMGLDSPPAISKVVVGKMGLKNVPGLRLK